MKVSELEGEALDLWVARAEGYEFTDDPKRVGAAMLGEQPPCILRGHDGRLILSANGGGDGHWEPSSADWAHAGPIIERERLTLEAGDRYDGGNTYKAWVRKPEGFFHAYGPTLLVAAMRAYVASRFGEEVPEQQ